MWSEQNIVLSGIINVVGTGPNGALSFILHVVCPTIEKRANERTKERKKSLINLSLFSFTSFSFAHYFCIQRALLSTSTTHRTFFFVFICIEMKAECVVFHRRAFFFSFCCLILSLDSLLLLCIPPFFSFFREREDSFCFRLWHSMWKKIEQSRRKCDIKPESPLSAHLEGNVVFRWFNSCDREVRISNPTTRIRSMPKNKQGKTREMHTAAVVATADEVACDYKQRKTRRLQNNTRAQIRRRQMCGSTGCNDGKIEMRK